ncbi:right-handed parallel beta-helix repeat-containing protein [Naasia lichenicola]|uniref:Right handed beta helix domain-containing protein n=1 Tax=Naasia lichenicola TaxID=2565933 RepID=A0A4S4FKU9_9MICO|nr:right-handed parallel beta-helix repeat-containing protein [Naasia lichenicola]THG30791.1 hypothetical protein E6C64_09135 [Naasia lichenicola]THG32028.1 hypothetical protein E6C64_08280 [Naasia lichenicola]
MRSQHRAPSQRIRSGYSRFGLSGRAKALVGLGSALALVGGLSVATMVIADPQYVALCGADDCASTSVSASGEPSADPTVAVVALDPAATEVSLVNHNAVGTTIVSILGYFDSSNPAAEGASYSAADESLNLQYQLGSDEKRTVRLPSVPSDAKTVLVKLGGRDTATMSTEKAKSKCAMVGITSAGTVTGEQVRDALHHRAVATATPGTPTPSVVPGENDVVDDIIDDVTDGLGLGGSTGPTATPSPTATATPVPTATATASPEPAPAPAETAAPTPSTPSTPSAPTPPTTPAPAPSTGSGSGSGSSNPAGQFGVPAGTKLTVVYGDQTVTQAGAVIDSLDIHGRVIIRANNVTIKNSIVRGTDSGGKYGLVDNMKGYSGLKVLDTEIVPTNPNWTNNGIMGWNFELHGVNIHGTVDQVSVAGSNVVVADSWLHDSIFYADDPDHTDGSHQDNIEIVSGDNILVTGNTMTGTNNAAIQVTQDRGKVSNLTITKNFMDNGDCQINISEKDKGPISGITISNNTFGVNGNIRGCGVVGPTSTIVNLISNLFSNGGSVVVKKG